MHSKRQRGEEDGQENENEQSTNSYRQANMIQVSTYRASVSRGRARAYKQELNENQTERELN